MSPDPIGASYKRLITYCRPRCNVRTFISHSACLDAFTAPSSLKCRRPRCTVRTFNYSHIAVLGALSLHSAGLSSLYEPLFTFRRPRCTVRTFNCLHAAGFGELFGPVIIHMPPVSVHCTDLNYSHATGLDALYVPTIIDMPLTLVHCTDL
jgi:hypothetical protein